VLGLAKKLVLLFPPTGAIDLAARWTRFVEAASQVGGLDLPQELPSGTLVAGFPDGQFKAQSGAGQGLGRYTDALSAVFAEDIRRHRTDRVSRLVGPRLAARTLAIADRASVALAMIVGYGGMIIVVFGVLGIILGLIITLFSSMIMNTHDSRRIARRHVNSIYESSKRVIQERLGEAKHESDRQDSARGRLVLGAGAAPGNRGSMHRETSIVPCTPSTLR
jgi:hypothetical protein